MDEAGELVPNGPGCEGGQVGAEGTHLLVKLQAACRKQTKDLVLRIQIRSHMFLGLPDPDPLVRGTDPDPDPSTIKHKQ